MKFSCCCITSPIHDDLTLVRVYEFVIPYKVLIYILTFHKCRFMQSFSIRENDVLGREDSLHVQLLTVKTAGNHLLLLTNSGSVADGSGMLIPDSITSRIPDPQH